MENHRELCIFHVVSIAVGVIWLRHLSPTDGQELFGLLGCPLAPLSLHVLSWLVEGGIQNLVASQERDWEIIS